MPGEFADPSMESPAALCDAGLVILGTIDFFQGAVSAAAQADFFLNAYHRTISLSVAASLNRADIPLRNDIEADRASIQVLRNTSR